MQVREALGGSVNVFSGTVEGDIQVEESTPLQIAVFGNLVLFGGLHGNVQISKNTVSFIFVSTNLLERGNIQVFGHVGSSLSSTVSANLLESGDIQVFGNTGGQISVTVNDVDGNLQCKENDPDPIAAANLVSGEDDCND